MIDISIYSGKCDVADWFDDYDDEYLKNSKFYLSGQIVPLKIENQHDLAPYYPYLVAVGHGVGRGLKDGHSVVHFSKESFIDSEEKERLTWRLYDILRFYRKCKRNKIPYTVEEAVRQSCLFTPKENDIKIAEIVGETKGNVTVQDLIQEYGVRSPMHEYYRKELLEKMIELGWEEDKAKYWIWKGWYAASEEEKEVMPNAE